MHRHRKLIYRPDSLQAISSLTKNFQISCQGRRITAYIDNFIWLHLCHRMQQCLITSFTWRIYHNNICMSSFSVMCFCVFFILFWQNFFCFSNIKFCIFKSVDCCISLSIFNGLWNNFNSVNLFCFLC